MRQPENDTNGVEAIDQQFMEGTPVYDSSGNKLGSVDGYDPQANVLVVRKGFFFPHDFYAPFSAIIRNDADGVYLNMTEDDLKDEGYAVASQAMTSEMAPVATMQTAPGGGASAPYAPDAAYDERYATDGADVFATQQTQQAPAGTQPMLDDPADIEDDATGEITMPLAEEQLVPQVETVSLGDVHLHKGVRMVERQVTVPVGHDEVVVEHIAPDQFDASQPIPSNEIIIPILEEQVITQTYTVVKEYLRVRTKRVVEQQEVRAQTRQEYLETGDDDHYVETPEAPRSPTARPPTPPVTNDAPGKTRRRRRR